MALMGSPRLVAMTASDAAPPRATAVQIRIRAIERIILSQVHLADYCCKCAMKLSAGRIRLRPHMI
jgi:hypothetical protein